MPQSCSLCWLPLSSAFAVIFHTFYYLQFLLLIVPVQITWDKGCFAQLFFGEHRDPFHILLTLHLLNFPLLFHLLGPGSITMYLKFFRLSTCLAIHLYPCLFLLSVFLPVFKVFDPWEPEDSFQPLGAWVNAEPTNAPFSNFSLKDWDTTS